MTKSLATPYALLCVAAFVLLRFTGTLVNSFYYPYIASLGLGVVREAATICTAIVYLAVVYFAYSRPEFLKGKMLIGVGLTLTVASSFMVAVGFATENAALLCIGVIARSISYALAMIILSICFLELKSSVLVAAVVALGFLVGYAATPLVPYFINPLGASVGILFATALPIIWCSSSIGDTLDRIREGGAAGDLPLADPTAFISAWHPLFVCVLFFSVFNGFALTLNEIDNLPVDIGGWGFAIVLIVIYSLLVKGSHQEDVLFSFTALMSMAGLLLAPLTAGTVYASGPNALLRFAGDCFSILMWMSVVGMGKRNIYSYVLYVGYSLFLRSIGTIIGAVSGHVSNDMVAGYPMGATAIALVMAFLFFAFLWCAFRGFSFTETIHGITPVSHPVGLGSDNMSNASADDVANTASSGASNMGASDVASVVSSSMLNEGAAISADNDAGAGHVSNIASSGTSPAIDLIEQNCLRIGEAAGLTKREMEIFTMMARGRNGRFVMEHFTISHNTAKSHIKHIYSKLDVHSHQELIDLAAGVETTRNA